MVSEIDINNLVESIENSFMDNGVVFEVECVPFKEVVREVRYFKTIKDISECPNLFEEHQWVRIADGHTYAFVGVKSDEDKLEVFVDVSEDCIIDDFEQMLVDGIKDCVWDAGIESVLYESPSCSRMPLQR